MNQPAGETGRAPARSFRPERARQARHYLMLPLAPSVPGYRQVTVQAA